MCSFSLDVELGVVLCHLDTMALAEALAFLRGAPWSAMRVFMKMQPGLESKHSSVKKNLSRDVKHSWVSSTTTKWVLVPYSPGFLLDVYQLHPSFPPAISTYSVTKGDEIRSSRPPSEICHTFPTGWEHAPWVRKYSRSRITFAAILSPASCFLLAVRLCCVGAREHKCSDTAFGSTKPQISVTLFTSPPELHTHKLGPVGFTGDNWSWVSACNFGGSMRKGKNWECMTVDLN